MTHVYPDQFYGRRKGKPLTAKQRELLASLLPSLAIQQDDEMINLPSIFAPDSYKSFWLEIGFGGGEHLGALALEHPDVGFIGAEAFMNGVASLVRIVHEKSLTNVRIFPDDVRLLLPRIPPNTLAKIFILFPDPWAKTCHHKRRLIHKSTLQQIASLLIPDGELHIASDHEDYIKWATKEIAGVPQLTPQFDLQSLPTMKPQGYPATRYETKALKEGRPCYYLRYVLKRNEEGF